MSQETDQLQRIEDKLDALALSSATITERVGNLRDQVQAHNLADAMTHKEFDGRLSSMEHYRTSWKARVATIAASVAVIVGVIASVTASAIAGVFKGG